MNAAINAELGKAAPCDLRPVRSSPVSENKSTRKTYLYTAVLYFTEPLQLSGANDKNPRTSCDEKQPGRTYKRPARRVAPDDQGSEGQRCTSDACHRYCTSDLRTAVTIRSYGDVYPCLRGSEVTNGNNLVRERAARDTCCAQADGISPPARGEGEDDRRELLFGDGPTGLRSYNNVSLMSSAEHFCRVTASSCLLFLSHKK